MRAPHQNPREGLDFQFPYQLSNSHRGQGDQSHELDCQSSRGLLTRKQAVKESHTVKTKSDKDANMDLRNAG